MLSPADVTELLFDSKLRIISMLIINDLHIGFNRQGGTTPTSKEGLRTYLHSAISDFLQARDDEDHLVILGDLFDNFEVSSRDWIAAYAFCIDWLKERRRLTLIAGNHDHSPKALRTSSFEALAYVLEVAYPSDVHVIGIDDIFEVERGVWAIGHCSNQDIFDKMLASALAQTKDGDALLLHANYDNHFASQSDHSLNVSSDQAREFIDRGVTLIFAHEHQARREMPLNAKQTGAEVIVLGNQWPTSVADCLGNTDKFAHTLRCGVLEPVRTWHHGDAAAPFSRVDWRELDDNEKGFIRVEGDATSAEASDVVNRIAQFRQKSSAFVVTNAVKVDGIAAAEDLPEAFEASKKFDVLAYIRDHLDAREFAMVEKLQKEMT
jgi:calcineurin-like phosphoesterase family protein